MSQTTAASTRSGTRKEVIHGNTKNFDEVIMAKRTESYDPPSLFHLMPSSQKSTILHSACLGLRAIQMARP